MRRTKPIRKIDVIGKFSLNPENAVPNIRESKRQDAFFLKPPNVEGSFNSIELFFIKSQKEHAAMLRLQEQEVDREKRQDVLNLNRKEKLAENLTEMRKSFIQVSMFVKEFKDKKKVAKRKVAEQKALANDFHVGVADHSQAIGQLTEFRDRLKVTVDEYKHYEKLLQDVVAAKPDMYPSIKDCTDRCDALMIAQEEIYDLNREKFREIEVMCQQRIKMLDDATFTLMGMQNELAALERSYNDARNECLKWEGILSKARAAVAKQEFNKERTYDGLQDIYRLLCRRRGTVPESWEVEQMADFIMDEVALISEILRDLEIQRGGSTHSDHFNKFC